MEPDGWRGRSRRSRSSRQVNYPAWLYHPFAELVWLAGIGWLFAVGDSRAAHTMLVVKAMHVLSLTPAVTRLWHR